MEKEFTASICKQYPGAYQDEFGNVILIVGKDNPKVCFSSHTDTVHRTSGKQEITIDPILGHIYKQDGECLGSDDGTGVWIMFQLIRAKVPGLYIFHRGEEKGGLGSSFIAEKTPELFDNIDFCIAFDRKGYESIITHQRGIRCCSGEFAASFAEQLKPMVFKADSTGSFTDSANYTDHVAECTNLSVGYFKQHTQNEYQDLGFLNDLIATLVAVDWDALEAVEEEDLSDIQLTYGEVRDLVIDNPLIAIELLYDADVTHGGLADAEDGVSPTRLWGNNAWDHLQ